MRVDYAINILVELGFKRDQARTAAVALCTEGLLVDRMFYLPPMNALYDDYKRLAEAQIHKRIPVRWVMCREIHSQLTQWYYNRRVPITPDWRNAFIQASDLPQQPDDPTSVSVIGGGSLFGVPIRIDPAARTPMWEIPE